MNIADFKLERYFAKHEFNAPYLLCASDCETLSIQELLAFEPQTTQHFLELGLGYTESAGHPALRQEIAKLYTMLEPENVLVFSGAEEGIFVFMQSMLQAGDHIIVQYPAYQSLYEIARSMGVEVSFWNMEEEKNWELDVEAVEQYVNEKTKALIVNSPHSPTGYVMSQEKFHELLYLVTRHKLILFSDEVYRFLELKEEDQLPAIADRYDHGISLGVMSKAFGLPGLRIGWLATKNKNLLTKLATFKDFTTICASGPSEFLATVALQHKKAILQRNLEIIHSNLALLDVFFTKYSQYFSWIRPRGGSIAFPEMKFPMTAEEFCTDLLDKKGVLLLPGSLFDHDEKHFRLGFGRKNLPDALSRLEEYIQEYLLD